MYPVDILQSGIHMALYPHNPELGAWAGNIHSNTFAYQMFYFAEYIQNSLLFRFQNIIGNMLMMRKGGVLVMWGIIISKYYLPIHIY